MESKNNQYGIFVYPTFFLTKLKGDIGIEHKEVRILYKNIARVFVDSSLPKNWVKLQCINDDRILYEDRSIKQMIQLLESRGFTFEKISRQVALNMHLVSARSLGNKLFLDNQQYIISPGYKTKVAIALQKVWDD